MAIPSIELSSDYPDPKLLNRLASVRYTCLLAVVAVSAAMLASWMIPSVDGLLPAGWKLMKANTALSALFCALSLVLSRPKASLRANYLGRVLACVVICLVTAILYQYLADANLGIDTLLSRDSSSSHPGKMSPQSATSFLLLGIITLGVRIRKRPLSYAIDALTLGLGMLVLVFTSGYYFGAMHLFGLSMQNRVGPQTLFCLFLLTIVVFNYRAQYGIFSVMLGDTIAGKTARLASPVALLLPFGLAILRGLAVKLSIMQTEYATALATSCAAMLFFCLVLLLSRRIGGLEQNIRDLSLRDELTRLYNRRGFYLLAAQALRVARRIEEPFSVLFLDVDNLKLINDSLGHEIGSELLQEIALILATTIRTSDVVGRLGGDEFVIAGNASADDLKLIVARLEEATARANALPNRRYTVSYSLGCITAERNGSETLDELLGLADQIMYQAKRGKRDSRPNHPIRNWLAPAE